jgi:hypothetical protein
VPVPARAFGLAPGWCRDDDHIEAAATKQGVRQIDAAYRPLRIVGGTSHMANDPQVAAA